MENDNLLTIRGLSVELMTARGVVHAISGVSLDIYRGKIHGLVGESGCGKSITSKSIMRLLPEGRARVRGSVNFDGRELLALSEKQMAKLRGAEISMIFQEAMTSLSPLKTVKTQLEGALENHTSLSRAERRSRAENLLERVGFPRAQAKRYPFELSGGMQQRVMIAQAISCGPKLLIADEPTTALDVTIQAQILALLLDLQSEYGMSVLLVTHNFGVVSQICDWVSVMYAGTIVETAAAEELLSNPMHPYTRALIGCIPRGSGQGDRLFALPGSPPLLYEISDACRFAPRCKYADERCRSAPFHRTAGTHTVACHHVLADSAGGI
ncbi:MAG: ABC transporter ATP-binding protein [Synergistaceae bacterium]|nr:ABC transporter ATP-binding protein [Synergistaceae bacterium]